MVSEQEISPEMAEAMKTYFTDIAEGKCPVCHKPVQEEKQVGRCVYALPCWHRMYQGKAKIKKPKEHPYFIEQREMNL